MADETKGTTATNNNPHKADSHTKTVSLEGLQRYHHEVCGALGLEQDTLKYEFTAGTYDSTNHEITVSVDNVKEGLDLALTKSMMMCDGAKNYFEKQYHGMFSRTYDGGSGSIDNSIDSSYSWNATGTKSGVLTATFTPGKITCNYVTADGSTTNKKLNTVFVRDDESKPFVTISEAAKTAGWTLGTNTNTSVTYTREISFDLGTVNDKTAPELPSYSLTGTGKVKDADPTTQTLNDKTLAFSKSTSESITLGKPKNFYVTNVSKSSWSTMSTGAQQFFYDNVASAPEFKLPCSFSITKEERDANGTNEVRWICFSTSSTVSMIDAAKANPIRQNDSITTKWGTYYWYMTGDLDKASFKFEKA